MTISQATHRLVAGLILGVVLTPVPAAALAAAPPPTEPLGPAEAEAALIAAVAPIATYSGTGTDVVDVSALPEALYVMDVTYSGSSGYLQIQPLDAEYTAELLELVSMLDGGPFFGRYPLNTVELGYGDTYVKYFQVTADGPWTIDILPWAAVQRWHGGEYHGVGPTVLKYDGPTGELAFSHRSTGFGAFSVSVLGASVYERDGPIWESGTVEGTSLLKYSPSIVIVRADGEWWLRAAD